MLIRKIGVVNDSISRPLYFDCAGRISAIDLRNCAMSLSTAFRIVAD
jgi:hypothetical protein